MLTDKHMHVANKLMQKKFPNIQGCQSTLLQQNHGFKQSVHLQCKSITMDPCISSTNIGGGIQLFDNKVRAELPASLEEQLAAVYQSSGGHLLSTRIATQQQEGGADCRLFSIAFTYHSLNGDSIEKLPVTTKDETALDAMFSAEVA